MVTRKIINSELERVPEERLEELYEIVKFYSRAQTESNGPTLLSKLRNITIDGPEDFSENLDSYLSEEKTTG